MWLMTTYITNSSSQLLDRNTLIDGLMTVYNHPCIKAFGERLNNFYNDNNTNMEFRYSYNYGLEFEKIIKNVSRNQAEVVMSCIRKTQNYSSILDLCKDNVISIGNFKKIISSKKEFLLYFTDSYVIGSWEQKFNTVMPFAEAMVDNLYATFQRWVSDSKTEDWRS